MDDLALIQKQLSDYSRKLQTYKTLTVSGLIQSHEYLRNEYIKDQEQRKKEIQQAIKEGIKNRLTYDYVNTKEFFNLPLKDIIKRYYDEDE